MTEAMFDTPMISAHTADGYQQALKALVKRAQAFIEADEDADSADLVRHARRLRSEMDSHDFHPRERMTRTEVTRGALRRFIDAVYEFSDLEDYDGGELGLNVWEAFERATRLAAQLADSYGPNDRTWAPEDDTNPPKTSPVPVPDPDAEPINGVRPGEWVKAEWDDAPRQILTGVVADGPLGPAVRLSDAKDGTYFGGYWVEPAAIGRDYKPVTAMTA